tara:strand:- start:3232 stop:7014 length:3783 start_codon:yes stop_codon:yes gene_type:complete
MSLKLAFVKEETDGSYVATDLKTHSSVSLSDEHEHVYWGLFILGLQNELFSPFRKVVGPVFSAIHNNTINALYISPALASDSNFQDFCVPLLLQLLHDYEKYILKTELLAFNIPSCRLYTARNKTPLLTTSLTCGVAVHFVADALNPELFTRNTVVAKVSKNEVMPRKNMMAHTLHYKTKMGDKTYQFDVKDVGDFTFSFTEKYALFENLALLSYVFVHSFDKLKSEIILTHILVDETKLADADSLTLEPLQNTVGILVEESIQPLDANELKDTDKILQLTAMTAFPMFENIVDDQNYNVHVVNCIKDCNFPPQINSFVLNSPEIPPELFTDSIFIDKGKNTTKGLWRVQCYKSDEAIKTGEEDFFVMLSPDGHPIFLNSFFDKQPDCFTNGTYKYVLARLPFDGFYNRIDALALDANEKFLSTRNPFVETKRPATLVEADKELVVFIKHTNYPEQLEYLENFTMKIGHKINAAFEKHQLKVEDRKYYLNDVYIERNSFVITLKGNQNVFKIKDVPNELLDSENLNSVIRIKLIDDYGNFTFPVCSTPIKTDLNTNLSANYYDELEKKNFDFLTNLVNDNEVVSVVPCFKVNSEGDETYIEGECDAFLIIPPHYNCSTVQFEYLVQPKNSHYFEWVEAVDFKVHNFVCFNKELNDDYLPGWDFQITTDSQQKISFDVIKSLVCRQPKKVNETLIQGKHLDNFAFECSQNGFEIPCCIDLTYKLQAKYKFHNPFKNLTRDVIDNFFLSFQTNKFSSVAALPCVFSPNPKDQMTSVLLLLDNISKVKASVSHEDMEFPRDVVVYCNSSITRMDAVSQGLQGLDASLVSKYRYYPNDFSEEPTKQSSSYGFFKGLDLSIDTAADKSLFVKSGSTLRLNSEHNDYDKYFTLKHFYTDFVATDAVWKDSISTFKVNGQLNVKRNADQTIQSVEHECTYSEYPNLFNERLTNNSLACFETFMSLLSGCITCSLEGKRFERLKKLLVAMLRKFKVIHLVAFPYFDVDVVELDQLRAKALCKEHNGRLKLTLYPLQIPVECVLQDDDLFVFVDAGFNIDTSGLSKPIILFSPKYPNINFELKEQSSFAPENFILYDVASIESIRDTIIDMSPISFGLMPLQIKDTKVLTPISPSEYQGALYNLSSKTQFYESCLKFIQHLNDLSGFEIIYFPLGFESNEEEIDEYEKGVILGLFKFDQLKSIYTSQGNNQFVVHCKRVSTDEPLKVVTNLQWGFNFYIKDTRENKIYATTPKPYLKHVLEIVPPSEGE